MSAVLSVVELEDTRVGELLSLWERWMREGAKSTLELGPALNCESFNSTPWGYWEHTSQEQYESLEYALAPKVNASIEDLETVEQMAVYHYHLAAVFRFNRADIGEIYDRARRKLVWIMPRHGIS
jgi:hypothetical protein